MLTINTVQRDWPKVKIIDVTLRDGGFRTGFDWSLAEIITLASATIEAGSDRVELGYIGGVPDLHNMKRAGPSAALTPELIEQLAANIAPATLCAMVHPSAAGHTIPFNSYRDAGLAMVRIVYHQSWHGIFLDLAERASLAGLEVSGNIALSSRYEANQLDETVRLIAPTADMVYLADTCGALLPGETAQMVDRLRTFAPLGFHAHDYLSLALANSHHAATAGASWIDGSLLGVGRGAGNLRLELWMALNQRHGGSDRFDLARLLPAISVIEARLGRPHLPDLTSLICGTLNLTPPQEDELRRLASDQDRSLDHLAVSVLERGEDGASITSILGARNGKPTGRSKP